MKGAVAVITGAARGIGKATALRLAADGSSLVLSGREATPLEAVAEEAKALGVEALVFPGDLRDKGVPAALIAAATARFGRIDALVNAAGIAKLTPFLELDLDTWQGFFDLHVTATFLCCQAAAKAIIERGGEGSIVNVSSVAASMAMYGNSAYGAAKGAVSSFTRGLGVELAQHNIRVNAVAPGPTATEQLRKVYAGPMYAERSRSIPMNRLAEPSDVADLIAFLVGPDSKYITGQIMNIDGGASAVGCYSYETYKRQVPK